jgi:hypothetical protein
MSKRIQKPFADRTTRVACARLPLTAFVGLGALALIRGTTRGELLRLAVERLLREDRSA